LDFRRELLAPQKKTLPCKEIRKTSTKAGKRGKEETTLKSNEKAEKAARETVKPLPEAERELRKL